MFAEMCIYIYQLTNLLYLNSKRLYDFMLVAIMLVESVCYICLILTTSMISVFQYNFYSVSSNEKGPYNMN